MELITYFTKKYQTHHSEILVNNLHLIMRKRFAILQVELISDLPSPISSNMFAYITTFSSMLHEIWCIISVQVTDYADNCKYIISSVKARGFRVAVVSLWRGYIAHLQ